MGAGPDPRLVRELLADYRRGLLLEAAWRIEAVTAEGATAAAHRAVAHMLREVPDKHRPIRAPHWPGDPICLDHALDRASSQEWPCGDVVAALAVAEVVLGAAGPPPAAQDKA